MPYCKYDKFTGKKPLLFYWSGSTDFAKNKVSQIITSKYSEIQGPGLYKDINEKYKKFSDAISDTHIQLCVKPLENTLADFDTTNASISISDLHIKAEDADVFAYSIKTLFLMDNPDKFWIDNLYYTIEYAGEYASKINFTVVNSEERGFEVSPLGLIAADVDGNGCISYNDSSAILSTIVDKSFVFPVEEKIKNYN